MGLGFGDWFLYSDLADVMLSKAGRRGKYE